MTSTIMPERAKDVRAKAKGCHGFYFIQVGTIPKLVFKKEEPRMNESRPEEYLD